MTSAEFASFAPDATGRIGSVTQQLARSNGAGAWVAEDVPFNALYDAVGRLTSLQAQGASPVFQWGHTYSYEANGNRTGGSITANGASMGFTSGVQSGTNRQSNAAGITVTTNAAGDITGLLGKTLAYDAAGRLSEATAVPPCPSGVNCSGLQTTLSRFNGWGQRFLSENDQEQRVFSYGVQGFDLLSQTTRNLHTSALSTTEHIYLPTASGPMPVAAVIDGTHYAVHSDHLNTPRRLSDSTGQTRWQWPYSGFGEIAPQSTPAAGQAPVNYALRYPGQVDDGNGLFYNWHRFYDPRVGRYTSADPIGLEGGFNRFGYVEGNPLNYVDPMGLQAHMCRSAGLSAWCPPPSPGPRKGAIDDFWRNYNDMRNANTIGGDKYFHCKANCEAARRGPVGDRMACTISDSREWFDQNIKGDPPQASAADEAANTYGRSWGANTSVPCEIACGQYRPNGLPLRY